MAGDARSIGVAPRVLAIALLGTFSAAQTIQDFDGSGTPYVPAQCASPPNSPPAVTPGGPSGNFLRLATHPAPNSNTISFNRTNPGFFPLIVADFDFRIIPVNGRADGLGFALLNTAAYGATGPVCTTLNPFVPEEPNFAGSVGIGFDIYHSIHPGTSGADFNNNHISLHFDGVEQSEFDAPPTVNLASGQWIHAQIILRQRVPPARPDVTIILTPRGGQAVIVADQFPLPTFVPYEARALLGARSGGQSAHHDIDNVRVQFVADSAASILSFAAHGRTRETGPGAQVMVNRIGNAAASLQVQYTTMNGTAVAGQDYAATSGTLNFGQNETSKSFSVGVLDDAIDEGEEFFLVELSNPSAGTVVAGPSANVVSIVDDERARLIGSWSPVLSTEIVAIHLHHLPDGTVMFWGGDNGEAGGVGHSFQPPRIWNPATGSITTVPAPHHLFCSGHSFLGDGRLLVAGGHETLTPPGPIRRGLPMAAIYDPVTRLWGSVPDMREGRWYPTNTTLANGDVLAVSGEIWGPGPNDNPPAVVNNIPEVWNRVTNTWRNLNNALFANRQYSWPLYPRNFLAPNGRVLNAGPNTDAQYIDTSGQLQNAVIAHSSRYRDEGGAVLYDDGKILLTGGSVSLADPPTDTAEVINLNDANPRWDPLPSRMAFPRKYAGATILADGTVLVTGGTRSAGFNVDAGGAVLEAESWDPITRNWSTLAPMEVKRIYHSAAILLRDGTVFVAGGGQPHPEHSIDNRNAQIFSPPYLFKGARPIVTSAPAHVHYGQVFSVATPDAANITAVNWIRLGSVTHVFDQNQRINRLPFSRTAGALSVTAPTNPNLAPPGHYMMFLIGANGVPSEAPIVQLNQIGITKTHLGNFTQGQSGATYTVRVTNTSGALTVGAVTVNDTLPVGLTLVSMAGTGWSCTGNTCSRSDTLGTGASFPPITVTVNVAPNAPAQVTNIVTVSGGGAARAEARDVTLIQPTCSYSINPTSQSFPSAGGSGSISVTAPAGCSWTAGPNAGWIGITSGASGSGPGTVNYSVAANASASSRSGNIRIGTEDFTALQSGTSTPPPSGALIFKEDFEVSSDYSYVGPGPNVLVPEGLYTIDTNPNRSHTAFASFGDHTTGSGRMLIANGRAVVNSVWSRRISGLTTGRQYRLRLFGASAFPAAPARLEFRINGAAVANQQLPATTGIWTGLSVLFNAGASEVTVAVVDLTTAAGGNDFVVDDIEVIDTTSGATLLKEDFEVSSDYTYVGPGPNVLFPEGTYTIDPNPRSNHSSFDSFGDHTTGSGRMLIANGRSVVNSVWSRTISGLVLGRVYSLRLSASSAVPFGPAQLQFRVGGIPLAPTLTLPLSPGSWSTLSASFAATGASAVVSVVDLSTAASGNDFVIDDIELHGDAVLPPPDPPTPGTVVFKEDFEVSSDYSYVAPSGPTVLYPEGTYTIASNPQSVHNLFCSFGDRTTGGGNMLIANGRSVVNSVWSRTVSGLTAGSQYRLSLYAASAYPAAPAQLQFMVAGTALAPTLTAPNYGGSCPAPGTPIGTIWQQLQVTFTASTAQVSIDLRDLTTAAGGNDFAVDDIQLVAVSNGALVFKEDFEVRSDYSYVAPSSDQALYPEGSYTIAPNPRSVHNLFCSFGDHTTGSGRMLIANGRSVVNSVWSRTVSGLTSGRQYRLSLYAASAYPAAAAQLQFMVAGTALTPTLTAPSYGGSCPAAGTPSSTIWQRLEVTFTTDAPQASLDLRDLSTAAGGNDFAIDDIELVLLP
jgi:uncharacterized repeat protein (TIGR01451 family)